MSGRALRRHFRLVTMHAALPVMCLIAPAIAQSAPKAAPDDASIINDKAKHKAKKLNKRKSVAAPVKIAPSTRRADATTAPAGPAASGVNSAYQVADVIVTAQRRSQNVQKLGGSISVISDKVLKDRNVNNLYDLQYQTPSLQVTPQFGSGQPSFAIRGVGFNDYASNNAPTVGLYIDEVAFPVAFSTNGLLFDVRRVEVLRGPQGTLYGRNTTGGAINYVLNKPTDYFESGGSVQYGRYNATTLEGFVSGPIAPNLKFRFAGKAQEGGAWQTKEDGSGSKLGDADRQSGRLLLDFEPTDSLSLELNLHGGRDRSDANGLYRYTPSTSLNSFYPGTYPVFPANGPTQTNWGVSANFAKEIGISPGAKPFFHLDTLGASLRAEQKLSFGTLTDLVSYDSVRRREYDNFDASQLAIADVFFRTRAHVFANELRLTSNEDQPLTWIAGVYYSSQELNDNYRSGFEQIYGLDGSVTYAQRVETISGFGQATYKLTEALRFTGGLRIEHETRNLDNFSSFFLSGGVIINPNNFAAPQSTTFTLPSGKAELQYDLAENDTVYVSFSRGVKSGGFTTYNSGSPQISTAPFQPEKVLAYEIGNKFTWPEERVKLNIAAFYYDYRDQQIQSATVNPRTGLIGAIVNAPRSHLFGGEVEGSWSPIEALTLTQSLGVATGEFDRFDAVLSAVNTGTPGSPNYVGIYGNRKGEALPAPKFTLNGSISYTWDIGAYQLVSQADYSYRSTYHSLFGDRFDVGGYALVNASLTLSPKSGNWSLAAFGQNIFNRRYDVTRNYFVDGTNVALAGLPATWGLRLSANF